MPELNRQRPALLVLGALLMLLTWLPSAQAGQSIRIGDYQVHYMALATASLRPEYAELYDLPRSNRRAYLNISVTREVDGMPMPVPAHITGNRRNLVGQTFRLQFKEVREGLGIYYLDDFAFTHTEPVRFQLEVQPEGEERSWTVNFEQSIYRQP